MPLVENEDTALLFKYEVLKARLEIRELFLDTVVREVYENIGQVLSLVRFQLASFEAKVSKKTKNSLSPSSELVGQSIRDLKLMCRSFQPDIDLAKKEGFLEGLATISHILGVDLDSKTLPKGTTKDLPEDLQLFIYNLLREMIISINTVHGHVHNLKIKYKSDQFQLSIKYTGENISWDADLSSKRQDGLPVPERAKLINGKLTTKDYQSGIKKLILEIPLKTA